MGCRSFLDGSCDIAPRARSLIRSTCEGCADLLVSRADRRAAPAARAGDDKPWAAGVSAENQKAALDLYNDGAKAFGDADYKDALATYTRALALWDHPAIRYNIAVCLINLDRPVEALDNLEHAMRFGAAPLGPDCGARPR